MKKNLLLFSFAPILLLLSACGGAESSDINGPAEESESQSAAVVDVCKCLTEPVDSPFSVDNRDACRDAISRELGVENWEKINFSEEPELSARFDALAARCKGDSRGEEEVGPGNNALLQDIGAPSGYIWENVNVEAQIYTTLAFHEGEFRISVHSMNNQTDSKNFNTLMRLTGSWTNSGANEVKGLMEPNQVEVSWVFNDDYTECINNKGVTFTRIRVQ